MAKAANPTSLRKLQADYHHLYRHFDKGKQLLYVGVSFHTIHRLLYHKGLSGWFDDIATVTIEKFDKRIDALRAELRAIIREKPIHNCFPNRVCAPSLLIAQKDDIYEYLDGKATLTDNELRIVLFYQCMEAGGQNVWADRHGFSKSLITKVLKRERRVSDRIRNALGYDSERVITAQPTGGAACPGAI
jgi:hypothetical protein